MNFLDETKKYKTNNNYHLENIGETSSWSKNVTPKYFFLCEICKIPWIHL